MNIKSTIHSMGKDNYQWRMTVFVEQNRDSYRYKISDPEDTISIKTGWLSVKLSIIVDEAIENIIYHSDRFATIPDVMCELDRIADHTLFHYETEDKPQ